MPMSSTPQEQLELAGEAFGQAEAERLRALLEAHDIPVWLSGESAGAAIGLSIGRLGRIQLMVRSSDLEQARALLRRGGLDPD